MPTDAAAGPADLALWRALGGRGAPDLSRRDPAGFFVRILAVDRAPRSQLDALSEATAAGLALPGPVACVAGSGEGFHGLRGRAWAAEPGNLHLAVALPAGGVPARNVLAFSLLPAVAAAEAIEAATDGRVRPGIKWVNDLLVAGAKVAGVLTTTRVAKGRIDLVLLGIGVNVAVAPAVPPTPFVPAVGRIPDVSLDRLADALLAALARRTREAFAAGAEPILAAYRERQVVVGRRVRVYREGLDDLAPAAAWPRPVAAGVVREIRDDLSLLVGDDPEPVTAGRLAFESACAGLPR